MSETNETELLYERIDELNTACTVLRENLESERLSAQQTIDALTNHVKQLRQMVDRLQLHLAQGVEL